MVATVNTAALRRKHERQYVARRIGIYTAAIIAALLCAGPFVWSAITAFKQNRDLYNPDSNPFVFNRPPTPDHVTYLFTGTGFLTFAWNTLWVGLLVVLIGATFGFNSGYAINPARDLGPRVFTAIAGWGTEVFRAGNAWWWVPVVAPLIGGVLGGWTYDLLIGRRFSDA